MWCQRWPAGFGQVLSVVLEAFMSHNRQAQCLACLWGNSWPLLDGMFISRGVDQWIRTCCSTRSRYHWANISHVHGVCAGRSRHINWKQTCTGLGIDQRKLGSNLPSYGWLLPDEGGVRLYIRWLLPDEGGVRLYIWWLLPDEWCCETSC